MTELISQTEFEKRFHSWKRGRKPDPQNLELVLSSKIEENSRCLARLTIEGNKPQQMIRQLLQFAIEEVLRHQYKWDTELDSYRANKTVLVRPRSEWKKPA